MKAKNNKGIIIVLSIMIALTMMSCDLLSNQGMKDTPGSGSSSAGSSSSAGVLTAVYVATNGSDLNDGSATNTPVKSIQKGLDLAMNNAVVYVGLGVYSPGSGLNSATNGISIGKNGIRISGGWNSGFVSQSGKSELDGNGLVYHVVYAAGVNNIRLDNLVVRRGNANSAADFTNCTGGGVYWNNVSYSIISNCVISNNTAIASNVLYPTDGVGGILITGGTSNTIDAIISDNSSVNEVGGIKLSFSSYNIIKGSVQNNTSLRAGGINLYLSSYNTITASVSGNTCTGSDGGGILLILSSNNTINSEISGNTALGAGGLCLGGGSCNNTISGNIHNNTGGWGGAGIRITTGSWYPYAVNNNIINASVYNNTGGAGINLWTDSTGLINGNTINGAVYGNGGHGISLFSIIGTTITSAIHDNDSVGIYINTCINTSINGTIYNHNTGGGGLYIDSDTNTTIGGSLIFNNVYAVMAFHEVNLKIISSTITNNNGDSIVLDHSGLSISNNLLEAPLTYSIIRLDDYSFSSSLILKANTFATNENSVLFNYQSLPLVTKDNWTDLNNAGALSNTAEASGNKVTNL